MTTKEYQGIVVEGVQKGKADWMLYKDLCKGCGLCMVKCPINAKGEKCEWKPNPLGSMRGDVWTFPTLAGKAFKKEKTAHPAQKPEALITELIKAFCPKNTDGKYDGIILDPFHGSGTLAVCCEKLNKQGHEIKWVGIELEQKWCDIAQQRLANIQ